MTNHARLLGSEFLGTTLLMIGGPGAVILGGAQPATVALSFGLTVVLVTAIVGPRSGAHVNPAVTLAMLMVRRIDGQQATMAWIGQFLGAALGGGVVLAAADSRPGFERGTFFANGWGDVSLGGYDWPGVLIVEFVTSVIVVVVALTLAGDRHGWGIRALVMGATLAAVALMSLSVTNVGANPARSIGTAIFASSDTPALGMVWMFLLAPLAGSVAAVAVWLMIDDTRLEQTGLFLPSLAQTRDIADRVVGDVVETVDEVIERAGRVDDER
jgi:aquaporin Z